MSQNPRIGSSPRYRQRIKKPLRQSTARTVSQKKLHACEPELSTSASEWSGVKTPPSAPSAKTSLKKLVSRLVWVCCSGNPQERSLDNGTQKTNGSAWRGGCYGKKQLLMGFRPASIRHLDLGWTGLEFLPKNLDWDQKKERETDSQSHVLEPTPMFFPENNSFTGHGASVRCVKG